MREDDDVTINVPVVYIARDIMILMQANPLQRPLEGVGPENQDFLGPERPKTKASDIWAQVMVWWQDATLYVYFSYFL